MHISSKSTGTHMRRPPKKGKMRYIKVFSRNRIHSSKKSDSGTVFHSITIQKFALSLLVLSYGCFAIGMPISADEAQSAAWQEAFTLIDKGDRKKAAVKLEALLQNWPCPSQENFGFIIHSAIPMKNFATVRRRLGITRELLR